MDITYKTVQSKEKPLEIDITSSANGVYIRRNIIQKEKELDDETKSVYYEYQEAFLTLSEYEMAAKDLLVGQINDEDNTAEYEAYKKKLDTGVLYLNGKYYKPKWTSIYYNKALEIMTMFELRQSIINVLTQKLEETDDEATQTQIQTILSQQSDFDITSLTLNIYDETADPANVAQMTPLEIFNLWYFLTAKQEEFFNEYKASLVNNA